MLTTSTEKTFFSYLDAQSTIANFMEFMEKLLIFKSVSWAVVSKVQNYVEGSSCLRSGNSQVLYNQAYASATVTSTIQNLVH